MLNVLILDKDKSLQEFLLTSSVYDEFAIDFVSNFDNFIEMLSSKKYILIFSVLNIDSIDLSGILTEIKSSELNESSPLILLLEDGEHVYQNLDGVIESYQRKDFSRLLMFLNNMYSQESVLDGRILLLDSSELFVGIFRMICDKLHIQLDVCSELNCAMKMCDTNNYDLIIADIVLSNHSHTFSFINEIKHSFNKRATPIMIISSDNDIIKRRAFLNLGVNEYLNKKELDMDEVYLRVKNLVLLGKFLKKLELQKNELKELTITDSLTGLRNRHFLDVSMSHLLSNAYRHKIDISIVMLDIDKFKFINDTYGHQFGDDILKELSKILVKSFRNGDLLIRYGGEEFIIILNYCNRDDAFNKIESFRKYLSENETCGISVTCSFGITSNDAEKEELFAEIFSRVDEALYISKNAGRNKTTLL